nr:hypothetical protein CFP56_22479 [Quercus suber]
MMWPVAEFYEGSNQLSTEEVEFANMFQQRGREDMAQLVLQGRKYQRFLFFLGGGASAQREEFDILFQGLRQAVDEQCTEPYSDWRSAAIAKVSARDPVYERLMRAERQGLAHLSQTITCVLWGIRGWFMAELLAAFEHGVWSTPPDSIEAMERRRSTRHVLVPQNRGNGLYVIWIEGHTAGCELVLTARVRAQHADDSLYDRTPGQ